jgi:hypothetical protein
MYQVQLFGLSPLRPAGQLDSASAPFGSAANEEVLSWKTRGTIRRWPGRQVPVNHDADGYHYESQVDYTVVERIVALNPSNIAKSTFCSHARGTLWFYNDDFGSRQKYVNTLVYNDAATELVTKVTTL